MKSLEAKGLKEALVQYIRSNRPFFGICIGMQSLFEGSEESPEDRGLGIIPSMITKFNIEGGKVRVPQIGWNGVSSVKNSSVLENVSSDHKVYFVHSFCAMPTEANLPWIGALTDYGQRYISMVQKGNIVGTQFHPEKSGAVGLQIINAFLSRGGIMDLSPLLHNEITSLSSLSSFPTTQLAKRVIACLDVRANDAGDLVVTKGDQYDVREVAAENGAKYVFNYSACFQLLMVVISVEGMSVTWESQSLSANDTMTRVPTKSCFSISRVFAKVCSRMRPCLKCSHKPPRMSSFR